MKQVSNTLPSVPILEYTQKKQNKNLEDTSSESYRGSHYSLVDFNYCIVELKLIARDSKKRRRLNPLGLSTYIYIHCFWSCNKIQLIWLLKIVKNYSRLLYVPINMYTSTTITKYKWQIQSFLAWTQSRHPIPSEPLFTKTRICQFGSDNGWIIKGVNFRLSWRNQTKNLYEL